jgi:glycosyltransferase involved in cell wall biosynthesis
LRGLKHHRHNRIVFDFTTSAMWSGPPAGIVRVETSLARWGLAHLQNLTLAFFDPQARAFRAIDPAVARRLMAGESVVDTLSFVSPARHKKRRTDRIPQAVQPFALWFLQSRRMMLRALERKRLGSSDPRIAALIDRIQRALMNERYRALMVKPDGTRRAYLPISSVVGRELALGAGDTLVCAGAGWNHNDIGAIVAAKRRSGFRLVLFCHDTIPLMFPQFYRAHDVAAQGTWCAGAFPAADLVLFASQVVEADARAWCRRQGVALGASAIVPLGADLTVGPAAALPDGLQPGRYALLVSTIEPRKGHRMIYEAWLDLLAAGIPQRADFKLVFAGRPGWMVDDLLRNLRGDPRLAGTLMTITDAGDPQLSALYRDAAFCIYPSRYEGFGLPVIEAFHHGKAVLASNGGALAEVVRDFSPCIDPDDGAKWRRMLHLFIEEPAARRPYEERIRTAFRHPGWNEAAAQFFAAVMAGTTQAARSGGAGPPE